MAYDLTPSPRVEGRRSPTHHVVHKVDGVDAIRRVRDDIANNINTFAVRAELVRVVGATFDEGVVAWRVGDELVGHAVRDESGLERHDDLADDLALLRVQRVVDALVLREMLPADVRGLRTVTPRRASCVFK